MKFGIFFLLAARLAAQEPAPGIRVVRADDGWFNAKTKLKTGDPLSGKEDLNGTKAAPLVLACASDVWRSYTCRDEGCQVHACAEKSEGAIVQTIHLKPPAHGDVVASLFRHQRDDARTLGVRGGGNPNDGVVLASADAAHWGPALTRVLEGTYCFRLTPLPAGNARTFTLEWDRRVSPEGIAKMPGLNGGVYTLEKGDAGCRFTDVDSAPAWVLVVPEPQFAEVNDTWKSYAPTFKELTDDGATPTVVSTVRRAILSSLSDSIEKK